MEGEHPGSRDMYDFISKWETCSILVSKNLRWSRFGLLGIMSDYVLSHIQGDIVEIGVGESSIFFTELSKRHQRHVYHCDISPSEITNCSTIPGVFGEKATVFTGTSDDFFKITPFTPIAVGFIDGDHNYEFVKRDFDNMFSLMVDNGYIFIHDMYPPTKEYLSEHRCGDGYRLRQYLEYREDVDIFTFPWGAMGVGLTMVRKLPEDQPYYRAKQPACFEL